MCGPQLPPPGRIYPDALAKLGSSQVRQANNWSIGWSKVQPTSLVFLWTDRGGFFNLVWIWPLEVVKSGQTAFWAMCFRATLSSRRNYLIWIMQGVGQDDMTFPWGLQYLTLLIFLINLSLGFWKLDSQGSSNLMSLIVASFWKIWHSLLLLFLLEAPALVHLL